MNADPIIELFRAKKVLITGGAGFVGTHLAQKLVAASDNVVCLDNYLSGRKSNHIAGVSYVEGDVNNIIEIFGAQKFDYIFHFGEYSRVEQSLDEPHVALSNIYKSLLQSRMSNDLIYFVEDDYIHADETILEMLFSYEKFFTLFKKDLVLIPSDYPYLYMNDVGTKLYLGEKKHWRLIKESLVTFMTSRDLILQNFNELEKMGQQWSDPWEKPLHKIYEKYPCLSPVPSLAIHCSNINSAFII